MRVPCSDPESGMVPMSRPRLSADARARYWIQSTSRRLPRHVDRRSAPRRRRSGSGVRGVGCRVGDRRVTAGILDLLMFAATGTQT